VNNSYRHIHQPSSVFHGKSKSAFALIFTHLPSTLIQKSKTNTDFWSVVSDRPNAAKAPQLCEKLSRLWPPKCDNWKNSYIALTQPQVDRLRPYFTRWYSVAPRKLQNYENPLWVKSKMADNVQICNIRTPISLQQLKLETSSLVCALTTRSNFHGMQKLGQMGCDPI